MKCKIDIKKALIKKAINVSDSQYVKVNRENTLLVSQQQIFPIGFTAEKYSNMIVDALNKNFGGEIASIRNNINANGFEIELNPSEALVDKYYSNYLNEFFNVKTFGKNIKPGVSELFESDTTLANQVYEALGFKGTKSVSQLDKLKTYLKEEDYRLKTPAPSWITDPTTSVGKMLEEINIPVIKDTVVFLREQNQKIQSLKSNANLITNDLYKQAGINPVKLLEDESIQLENIQRVRRDEKRLPTPELDKLNTLKTSNRDLYEQIEELGDKQAKLIRESSNAFEKEIKKFFNSLMEYEQKELDSIITPQQKQQAQQLYSQYLDSIFPDSKVKLEKKFADIYNIVYNNENIGTIDIPSDLEGDTISIGDVNINPEYRGKGLGVETYKAAMKIAGKPLESFMATDEANRVWNSLIKQGLAEKTETGFVTISPILGSKQDIEGFKEFANTNKPSTQTAEKLLEKAEPINNEKLFSDLSNLIFTEDVIKYLHNQNMSRLSLQKYAKEVQILADNLIGLGFTKEEVLTRIKCL